MNKKGLIFIFLFVVASVGAVALTNAAPSDSKVDITLRYYPNHYVDMGEVWVEFDQRLLDDNFVYGENDIVSFAFFYDVSVISWAGGANAHGGGFQTDEWFYAPLNNKSEGYQGWDLYNVTRYAGILNVMLDDYDLGMSNFDVSAITADTYQDINIELEKGWHFLTVMAAELVSDANHTTWHWEFVKDEKQFYIGETRDEVPPLIEEARQNYVNVQADAIPSADLTQNFSWTSFYDFMHPVAEPNSTVYNEVPFVSEGGTDNIVEVQAVWNASDTDLGLTGGTYGSMFTDIYSMGPANYTWFVNNGDMMFGNDMDIMLSKGANYVWFIVFGFKSDDFSLLYGNPSPSLTADTAVFRVGVDYTFEGPTGAGMSFGILISVSMLGLVTAMLLRRRK